MMTTVTDQSSIWVCELVGWTLVLGSAGTFSLLLNKKASLGIPLLSFPPNLFRRNAERPDNRNNNWLAFLDVFRVLAFCWVVANHLGSEGRLDVLLRSEPTGGEEFKRAVHDHPLFGPLIGNSGLAVEVFLVLSGVLAVQSWARRHKPEHSLWRNAASFLFRRWLRLVPPVLVFLLLAISPVARWLLPQFHFSMTSACKCRHLVSHALLLGNWQTVPTCFGWLFYLGLDFQCHLLVPFLLHLIGKCPRAGFFLTLSLLLASTLLRGWHCRAFGICNKSDVDIPFVAFPGAQSESLTSHYKGSFSIYARPATKCGPFLVGLLLGLWIQKWGKQFAEQMNAALPRKLFAFGLFLAIAAIYGILPEYWHPDQGDTLYNTVYTACFESVFASGIAAMIAACLLANAKRPFQLSPLWAFLSRLSFAAYLVHMPVVFLFNHIAAFQSTFSVYGLLLAVPPAVFLSFAFAFLFHHFVESPLSKLIHLK